MVSDDYNVAHDDDVGGTSEVEIGGVNDTGVDDTSGVGDTSGIDTSGTGDVDGVIIGCVD